MEILETQLPGVYFEFNVVDDEVELSPANLSPQTLLNVGSPRLVDGARESHIVSFREAADGAVGGIPHSQCLEFLGRKGPNLLMRNLKDKDTICRMLLNMAENVKALPPGNEPLPCQDVLSMSLWKASLGEVIKEMKTVEEKLCPSLIGISGVYYVLTSSPYSAFLRALTAEIADRRRS